MPLHTPDEQLERMVSKRVLKDTLYRFTYMTKAQLLRRVNRLKNKEKLLATMLVAGRLGLESIDIRAQSRFNNLYGSIDFSGRSDRVVY